MGLRADTKYEGVVGHGSALYESSSGTPGYQIMIDYEGGQTDFVIWLTRKNRDKAIATFERVFGVTEDQLASKSFLEFSLGLKIVGTEITFGTRDDTYNGKTTVKVSYIGRRSAGPKLASVAAEFFSKAKPQTPERKKESSGREAELIFGLRHHEPPISDDEPPISDDDLIPF